MNIKVGDYVAWNFRQHCFDKGASIGLVTPINATFKGEVTRIKTKYFFFFDRDYPLYKVNGVWVRRVKPIVRKYAEIVKPCKNPRCITFCRHCINY